MNRGIRRVVVFCAGVGFLACGASPAGAVVTRITGTARATVVQFTGPFPLQTDLSIESVPLTVPEPPAVARARLDRIFAPADTTGAAQAIAVFERPNLTGVGNPTDAGLDLGGFSDDTFTRWFADSEVIERRTQILGPGDIGQGVTQVAALPRVRSRVLLSGVMAIVAEQSGLDLTGTSVNLTFSVTQRRPGQPDATLVAGEVTLAGGPGGVTTVRGVTGALSNVFLPIVDVPDLIPGLPLVQAIFFAGLEIPYEYDVPLNEEFDLELSVRARVNTIPGGVGAAATFGTPQEGIPSVFERVKEDDRGHKLARALSRYVDTTGRAYVNGGGATGTPFDAFRVCGAMGAAPLPALAVMMLVPALRVRRRRRDGTTI